MGEGTKASDETQAVGIPRLLTARQLAAATGLPIWREHELVARGLGPPHLRIGRTLRFPADQVVRWIGEQSKQRDVG